jgi:hypothetical protein
MWRKGIDAHADQVQINRRIELEPENMSAVLRWVQRPPKPQRVLPEAPIAKRIAHAQRRPGHPPIRAAPTLVQVLPAQRSPQLGIEGIDRVLVRSLKNEPTHLGIIQAQTQHGEMIRWIVDG